MHRCSSTGRPLTWGAAAVLIVGSAFSVPSTLHAQLVECGQVNQQVVTNAPGGCVAKTLREQVGAGQGDLQTPGSSIYLIKRDPARSIRRGRQLFQRKFTAWEGVGPRVGDTSEGSIILTRALGAGLSDSCAACHGRPRGAAGHGGDVNTFPDSRDAPHLFGVGLVEMLADEITRDLRAIRESAVAAASNSADGEDVTRRLVSKGLSFGSITAHADGSVDTSQIEGVDADLRVKPFFHDGRAISLREFIVGALNDEMGLQAWDPILCAVTDPMNPEAAVSPAGFEYDPALDDFTRPAVCEANEDADLDGVAGEVDPALVDHLEFYLLNYFKPGRYDQNAQTRFGAHLMDAIGCTSCHVKDLVLENDRRVADVETTYDPDRGIFNDLYAEASTLFGVMEDGDAYPQLLPLGEPFVVRNIFTDFKRHDLGPEFEERDFDGSRNSYHVTEPLWGVGNTAPYGHDGRSINLDSVIRRHGGEAESSARAYAGLNDFYRNSILGFLESLIVFPPDDTASNLNPGNPFGDPQDPLDHGSINLGALFQIAGEGAE